MLLALVTCAHLRLATTCGVRARSIHILTDMSGTRTVATTSAGSTAQTSSRGRGAGTRGRGGRGQGRGRGGVRGGHRGGQPRQQLENALAHGQTAPPRENPAPKPPLTHFLAMPLGHHAALRERMSEFTQRLLAGTPAVPGLDASIVIAPRRLHLTLGVMALPDARAVDAALALLARLRPHVLEFLRGEPLRVALRRAHVMPPERGDLERAHVLWVGPPPEGEDAARLKRVAEFVHREFIKAGLVVDEKRPLKLHVTILNTTYRRPRPRGARVPFSYAAVLSSPAFASIEQPQSVADNQTRGRQPVPIDLGEWTVDEIQICEMGSWGPEGEYVSVGHITI